MNVDTPTYSQKKGGLDGNVLDLFLVSSSIAESIYVETFDDSGRSHHFPVILIIPLVLERICRSSGRICVKSVDWKKVAELMNRETEDLSFNSIVLKLFKKIVKLKLY